MRWWKFIIFQTLFLKFLGYYYRLNILVSNTCSYATIFLSEFQSEFLKNSNAVCKILTGTVKKHQNNSYDFPSFDVFDLFRTLHTTTKFTMEFCLENLMASVKVHYIESVESVMFMEQNMRFGEVLGWFTILKKNWGHKVGNFSGCFLNVFMSIFAQIL